MKYFYRARRKLYKFPKRQHRWKNERHGRVIEGEETAVPAGIASSNPMAASRNPPTAPPRSNAWTDAFRRAAAAEEEGGRELRQFIETEGSAPAALDDAGEVETEESSPQGGFSQPAALAAFTRHEEESGQGSRHSQSQSAKRS